jgi:type IV pilus assembly protein PilC
MPKSVKNFVWEGEDAKGVFQSGLIASENIKMARALVQQKNINIKKITQSKADKRKGKKIKLSNISEFTRQFATLSQAGVPVLRSLDIIVESSDNPKMQDMVRTIHADINDGKPLSVAFGRHPKYFDVMYVGLVAVGETSGSLDSMLLRLASHMERTQAIIKKIKKALTYPVAILVIAFFIVIGLLMTVVPVFQEMFESMGASLPAFTQMIVDASEAVQSYWHFIFSGIAAFIFSFKKVYARSQKLRDGMDRLVLKLPVFGDLIKQSLVSRFARVLSTTFSSGVPIVDGLDSVEQAIDNIVYKNAIKDIKNKVKTGASIADSIKSTGVFPPTLYHMVAIGEESGSLDGMLTKTADIFDDNVNDSVDALTTLLEPMVMVLIAGILGGVIIALYLPLFDLGSIAGG